MQTQPAFSYNFCCCSASKKKKNENSFWINGFKCSQHENIVLHSVQQQQQQNLHNVDDVHYEIDQLFYRMLMARG